MIGDFLKALGQLGDPKFRRVFLLSTLLTVGLLAGFYVVASWLITLIPSLDFTIFGYEISFFDETASVLAYGMVIWLMAVLMFPVAALFIGLFLEEIADAVEDRHYPHLPKANPVPFWDGVRDALGFLGVLILANTGAFVLYLVLPFAAIFIFWGLNGFLLGREYFTLTALRRVGRQGARDLRRRHAGRIWAAGVLMAIPLTIPVVNLLVPILGAATFTHLFHMLRGER